VLLQVAKVVCWEVVFVDPNGKPFISLGIDTITFVGDTTAALRAKYGNQSNWADNVVTRLVVELGRIGRRNADRKACAVQRMARQRLPQCVQYQVGRVDRREGRSPV
jgi:hypothetical protein